jgi:chromosome segregation ATPase
VLAREADLQHLLASHDQEARQARDAEVRLLDRVGQMERENQRMREESEGMRQESEGMRAQLQHLRDEQERHTVADQTRGFHLRQLEDTIAAQTARISCLEADGETLRGERDRAWQQRDEALRQARATEAELQTKVRALDVKAGNASEETRRLMAQIHHLHEELEQTFLQGQAGDQLIAAQHQQLVRAQSLMARLLVQTNQTSLGTQAVAVEVLPPQAAKAISGSTQGSGPERQGRGGGLLRRFWTP